ncbi:putative membrane protein [Escherichia coli 3431]|nr:putative membrane protein [Escherichia coli 3431]
MNALKTVYSSRFRVRLIICILNTIYWLLFSTISAKNQGGL